MENVGVLDFETDPFVAGRVPYPFACCIYFPEQHKILWEPNIIDKVIAVIRRLNTCTLYAHNGGKFDFHYLIERADQKGIQIRDGRIVQMQIGKVTLKDSWPLMPFPLAEYRKTPIDYAIFEKHRRNIPKNRAKITEYLLDDCRFLHELVTGFKDIVGPKDTIGSAAFYQMREMHIDIWKGNEAHDDIFRHYFFGGRVQAFDKGVHTGRFKYLDINSAYPYAMQFDHPHGMNYVRGNRLPKKSILGPCFVHCVADSRGALPLRDGMNLEFPVIRNQEFFATGWEILAGLETHTLDIRRLNDVWIPSQTISFNEYVTKFFTLRQQAKKQHDPIKRLAYKYLLNSGYGKFAQNPREFKRYRLAPYGEAVAGYDWETDYGAISLWSKPAYNGTGFYDVATGASITGFVRAMLWRAIRNSTNVLYVDTDSMICERSRVTLGGELGEWKLEGDLRRVAVAGKKLYAIEWTTPQDGSKYRIASKGARLSFSDILSLCKGDEITWQNDAPTFSLKGAHFIERTIRAT